jgi:nucleotide-binding universal stress UspA family protein
MLTIKQILVPTDFGEPADAAMTYGRELAGRFGARLHVLHVADDIAITPFGSESYATAANLQQELEEVARVRLNELVIDNDRSGPLSRAVVTTSSTPALAIVDYAKDNAIDLIVMGTHGRGAIAHLLLGSVAERVCRLASCPVLTVRHPEREFVRPDTLVPVAREETPV